MGRDECETVMLYATAVLTKEPSGEESPQSREAELEAELSAARAEIVELKARLQAMEQLLQRALEKAGRNSQNTSFPPSSDGPDAPKKEGKPPTGRKPGGQPGHKGNFKQIEPAWKVDETVPLKPSTCRNCGSLLLGDEASPRVHQVLDIIDFKPKVIEYHLYSFSCLFCGEETTACLPPGVPSTAYGPGLIALVALLTGAYRLSKRLAVRLVDDMLGIHISTGSVVACEAQVSAALEKPFKEAHNYAQKQEIKAADETSWKEGKARKKVWLWVLYTMQVTVYLIQPSRSTEAAKELLGKQLGILVTDRLGSYGWWELRWRQLCWAHMKRHFKKFIDRGGRSAEIGMALEAERRRLFDWWKRVQEGALSREKFRTYVAPLRKRVRDLLTAGVTCPNEKTAGTCQEIRLVEPALWTFVRFEGVDPTNNWSERSLRIAVIWRKLSFGTHSANGSRFVERMLTITTTLRQQQRNVIEYLTTAVRNNFKREPIPSILPTPQQA